MSMSKNVALNKSSKDWMLKSYFKWRRDKENAEDRDTSVVTFAKFLGINENLVSKWINGERRPGKKYIKIIAEKISPEIYDVLGMQNPDPFYKNWSRAFYKLSEDTKERLLKEWEQSGLYTARVEGENEKE